MSDRSPPGSKRWSTGLWRRPADGRKPRAEPSLLSQQLDDLGARLLVHDPLTQPVRNLYTVHQALGDGGWAAAEALAPAVIERAGVEGEILLSQDPSAPLRALVERLVALRADAVAAEEQAKTDALLRDDDGWEAPAVPEVSEASHEEYELMERSWIGTVPQDYQPTDHAPPEPTPT